MRPEPRTRFRSGRSDPQVARPGRSKAEPIDRFVIRHDTGAEVATMQGR